jgi:hypothetical protein
MTIIYKMTGRTKQIRTFPSVNEGRLFLKLNIGKIVVVEKY